MNPVISGINLVEACMHLELDVEILKLAVVMPQLAIKGYMIDGREDIFIVMTRARYE